jgi:hypothetical protein
MLIEEAIRTQGSSPGGPVSGTTGTFTGAVGVTGLTTLTGGAAIGDAANIAVGSSTGTKIGTATTQKLGFWNATPVVQQVAAALTTGFVAGSSTPVLVDSTFTGNIGASAYTLGDIVHALKTLGILAQ